MRYQAWGYFNYGGISITTRSANTFYCDTMARPERDVDLIEIPGRNGSVIFDNGRYRNVDRVYQLQISGYGNTPAIDNARDLVASLLAKTGYNRLTDTYEPDYYMRARIVSATVTRMTSDAVSLRVVFDRLPQMYFLSGESSTALTSAGNMQNTTQYTALPLIIVKTTSDNQGVLTINSSSLTVSGYTGDIYIDCDSQTAYNGNTNLNDKILLQTSSFPSLRPGTNVISFSGSITKVTITPRWWTL